MIISNKNNLIIREPRYNISMIMGSNDGQINYHYNNEFNLKPVFNSSVYSTTMDKTFGTQEIVSKNNLFYFTDFFEELNPLYEIKNETISNQALNITNINLISIINNKFSTLGNLIEDEIINKLKNLSVTPKKLTITNIFINQIDKRLYIKFNVDNVFYCLEIDHEGFEFY